MWPFKKRCTSEYSYVYYSKWIWEKGPYSRHRILLRCEKKEKHEGVHRADDIGELVTWYVSNM